MIDQNYLVLFMLCHNVNQFGLPAEQGKTAAQQWVFLGKPQLHHKKEVLPQAQGG